MKVLRITLLAVFTVIGYADPGAREMEIAIRGTEKMVNMMNDMVNRIQQQAAAAINEIAVWQSKIEALTEENITDYIKINAHAKVKMVNAVTSANTIIKGVIETTDLQIDLLTEAMDGGNEEFQEAIQSVQIVMGVQLKDAARQMNVLKKDVEDAQHAFEEAASMSANYKAIVEDNLKGKNGWLESTISNMRAVAYGSAAVGVLGLLPGLIISYGISASVVETEIHKLKCEMRSFTTGMENLTNRLDELNQFSSEMATLASSEYARMNETEHKLNRTADLVVANDKAAYWRTVVLKKLKSLKTFLEEQV